MTATDELRRLLDERGMKWWPMRNNGYYEDRDTEFVANGKKHTAHEWGDGFAVYNLTTEQVIAATLGSGTCHDVHELPRNTTFWPSPHFRCSECGAVHVSMEYVVFCPNCGRKVVSE